MSVRQGEFRESLLDPARAAPAGLVGPGGAPAGKRFDVYRNNVAVSLTEALIEGFPVLCKLVGEEFFRAMAGVYLRTHPPRSQILMLYGEDMPTFLAGFQPVAHLPYLPDIARLELARRQAFHAADAAPIDPARLQGIPPDRFTDLRLGLAPAVSVLHSRWPVLAIWRINTEEGAPAPGADGEDVLITRPDLSVHLDALPAGGLAFVEALQSGDSFGLALSRAGAIAPRFDLTATLGLLIAGQAITQLELPE